MKIFLSIALILLSLFAKAQFGQGENVMLLNGPCELKPYQNKLKPDFSLDARRTLFQKKWVGVMGIKAGVEYRRIHRLGIGVYFLNTRVFDRDFNFDIAADKVEYEFRYSTIYYERVLFFNRKWEVGSTLHLGGGNIRVFYQNPENSNERLQLKPVEFSTVELSAYGEYDILFWLGVGAGMGYRQVLGVNADLRKEFSSPIFVVNLQLKLIKLARSFYDEDVKYEY
ncbi:hypothetical protein G3O08_15830 [Cryomorpha ignava]|uniref:Outer membrane protein beta-barrel domain-containing protein n=1 Tax=Cryomorpha ignava TaxID=101383 RepID=A0A7K3WTG9_9FLAO|nr:hypothetical protein [Cryomorpha ignava]NEN24970.1 hypothetical protein [Cryomorpha ignava]